MRHIGINLTETTCLASEGDHTKFVTNLALSVPVNDCAGHSSVQSPSHVTKIIGEPRKKY